MRVVNKSREAPPQAHVGGAQSLTWKAGLAGGALLSRKARQPRLPRQAGEPLGPFVSFGARHVQAWEAGEAFLSFHSGGT